MKIYTEEGKYVYVDREGIHENPEECIKPIPNDEINTAKLFIKLYFRKVEYGIEARRRTLSGSYYYKHRAEKLGRNMIEIFPELKDKITSYVSNGAFITAAYELGYVITQKNYGGLNCQFFAKTPPKLMSYKLLD